ncbi:MAG: MBL fold metallo-hydrolase [Pirellulaceae bacterium]
MITGYSTALFSTWYFVEQFGVLFDCGDGVCAGLLQKARKIKHVFVSHADRDHLAGLLQFLQLNGRDDLTIHFPRDCGSFPALAEFSSHFDPHSTGTRWGPMTPEGEVAVRENLIVRAIENLHVPKDGDQIKSLTYIVESVSRKLKPEFQGMPGNEIAELRKQKGGREISNESRVIELIYSGDTPVETDGRYQNAKTLIHEATFLTRDEIDPDNPKRNKHSSLDALMEMVAHSNIQTLILGHFSSRYSNDQIDEAVQKETLRCGIGIPIKRVYPGAISSIDV